MILRSFQYSQTEAGLGDEGLARAPAWQAGALHILKPLESDLRPNSSVLVTQALRTLRNGLAKRIISGPVVS